MFEDFQKNSEKETERLRDQIGIFQGMFTKERQEKEDLINRLKPSQSVSFDVALSPREARSRSTAEPAKLRHTLSKNLSFGHGHHADSNYLFRSNQSSKNRKD